MPATQRDLQKQIEENPYFKQKLSKTDVEAKYDRSSASYDHEFAESNLQFFAFSRAENDHTSNRYYNIVFAPGGNELFVYCGGILKIDQHGKMSILDENRRPFTVENITHTVDANNADGSISIRYHHHEKRRLRFGCF